MYDAIFVNAPHHGPDYYSPIGVGILVALARTSGLRVDTLDFQRLVLQREVPWPQNFFPAAEEMIASRPALVYGFSVMNVGLPWAVRLAAVVRKLHPSALIVFGGPHATLLGHELLRDFPEIDVVAVREGERIIVPLLEAARQGGSEALTRVPNLLLRQQSTIVSTEFAPFVDSLDDVPLIDYDPELLRAIGILSVEAGRGCPYHCSFCSSHSIWTRKPRFKSAARLVTEAARYVEAAGERPEPLLISFEHDDFLANRPWFFEFAKKKMEMGASFRYGITARVNHITPHVAEVLADTGCVSVFMGLETGSDRLQTSSAKHLALASIVPRIRYLLSLGIHVSTNFILGFPDETIEEMEHTVSLMLEVRWSGADVNISVMCPEPGSALYLDTPEAKRVILHDGDRCDELRAGGIEIESMKPSETMHLVAIANENFDIVEIAAFARSIQLLMSDFPVTLSYLWLSLERSPSRLLDQIRRRIRAEGEIRANHAVDSLVSLSRGSDSEMEIALYESALSCRKRGINSWIPASAFNPQAGARYSAEVARLAGWRRTGGGNLKVA